MKLNKTIICLVILTFSFMFSCIGERKQLDNQDGIVKSNFDESLRFGKNAKTGYKLNNSKFLSEKSLNMIFENKWELNIFESDDILPVSKDMIFHVSERLDTNDRRIVDFIEDDLTILINNTRRGFLSIDTLYYDTISRQLSDMDTINSNARKYCITFWIKNEEDEILNGIFSLNWFGNSRLHLAHTRVNKEDDKEKYINLIFWGMK